MLLAVALLTSLVGMNGTIDVVDRHLVLYCKCQFANMRANDVCANNLLFFCLQEQAR